MAVSPLESSFVWRKEKSSLILRLLIPAATLLAFSTPALAQRHGGDGSSVGQGNLSSYSRPEGVVEKDALKDFHQTIAVQATSQQVAEFQEVVKSSDAAKEKLRTFLGQTDNVPPNSKAGNEGLEPALQNALNENRKFLAGFSDAQKAGLKDITKRLEKADSDLEQEQTRLSQILRSASPAAGELTARSQSLDKALTEYANQQLELGREMSIVLASGRDLAFRLPTVRTPVSIDGRTVSVSVSGALSQIEEQNGQRTFQLELNEDLSDLQQNIGALLHSALTINNSCGERVSVRQAMLGPSSQAGLLILLLHYERWSCARLYGQTNANELAEDDGTVEVKLTPLIDQSNALRLNAEFGRIDAGGMFTESLRSGDLGDLLREKISGAILGPLHAATDLKTSLPSALENSAVIESARFRDAGAGVLNIVFEGKTRISNEQANLLASQLNQATADKTAATQ